MTHPRSVDLTEGKTCFGNVIDGKAIAEKLEAQLKEQVRFLRIQPMLMVLIVGNRRDSRVYVRMKAKACERIGIATERIELPATSTQEEVVETVRRLNADRRLHGLLVQLPLPDHINTRAVLDEIAPSKDVDGLSLVNIGRLAQTLGRHQENFHGIACTPRGIMALIDSTGTDLTGKHAVVIGRSDIVGKPVSLLLLGRNATVTMCHSATADLAEQVRRAHVVVVAVGIPGLIRGEWIRPGAIVIDVGINSIDDETLTRGYRLVGDVEYEEARKRAGFITPVPGGCGPMTIAMLMKNTVFSAVAQAKLLDTVSNDGVSIQIS